MSGHSHWATIRRKKGAADAKRGQLFTKLAREIVIAAREGGGDPSSNIRLQYAVEKARANNMPKDNIERAIKRGTGDSKDGSDFEEITYEGYAPNGIALLISCVTDNRNRTIAEIRHVLNRYNGTLADVGSVAWQFHRAAYFSMPAEGNDSDKIFELAVESGADDVEFDDESISIVGPVESYKEIGDMLRGAGIEMDEAELKFIPNMEVELEPEETVQVVKVIETLEELDDVQAVVSNLSITEAAMAQLEVA